MTPTQKKKDQILCRLEKEMWLFNRKGASGFSGSPTAEEVTEGIDGTGLTAIVTGHLLILAKNGNTNKVKTKTGF